MRLQNCNFREDLRTNSLKLTWLHYQLLYGNEPTKSGLERAAKIKPMILAGTKRYEDFRQVHDIHKYFDEIIVSVVWPVCPTCHPCIGFLTVLHAVFGFG